MPGHTTTYAWRRSDTGGTVYMHRHLMGGGVLGHAHVDHRDGNGLNNTRANLRPCTARQNQANGGARRHNRNGLRGVVCVANGTFRAKIRVDGHDIHLGTFFTARDAALAYDKKARELFGEFARPNFPAVEVARG